MQIRERKCSENQQKYRWSQHSLIVSELPSLPTNNKQISSKLVMNRVQILNQINQKSISKSKTYIFLLPSMKLSQVSSSTKIYLDQINNYIQTAQGYQNLRNHLLKQLNQIDPDNPNSDQTLLPAFIENLRKWLLTDSSQYKSRAIDVLEDIIKHADDIVESYINTQDFCYTLSAAITYKFFNPFSKAIFDQNRLRLCSIVLFYHQKFTKDPTRYLSMFQLYKQLKEKNCTFPPKTFIQIPKVNQFKTIKHKNAQEKISDSDRIGVTFDSIIDFVSDCEKQFKNNKVSCANTQFVRALKVKAKTLFDLAQNNEGLELSTKQKQHAKQLYKQIRTMLKQIEKISEQKIKEQKIKSEKQFAQQKIEQISPNKKKQLTISQAESKIETTKQQNFNLLDEKSLIPVEVTKTPVKILQIPQRQSKETNLLDDDSLVQVSTEKNFTNVSEATEILGGNLQLSQKQVGGEGLKPIKKPPKPEEFKFNSQFDQLIDTIESSNTQKQSFRQQNLIETEINPLIFSKTSIKSVGKHSVRSEESDKPVNVSSNQFNSLLFKQDGENILEFQNAQHFSKFEVVNNYLDPNKYGQIPMDIDFSDSSSQQSIGSQKVTFNVGIDSDLFENKNQPYDQTFRTPKKQTSYDEGQSLQKDLQKLSLSVNINKQKEELLPNYNFGILADMREVKAYDYSQVQDVHIEKLSISNISEEERKITLTPQKSKNGVTSLNDLSAGKMNQKQMSDGLMFLEQNGEGDDEEFGNFQEVPTVFGMEVQNIGDEKEIGNEVKNDGRIMAENSPQKGQLIEENGSTTLYQEPLL